MCSRKYVSFDPSFAGEMSTPSLPSQTPTNVARGPRLASIAGSGKGESVTSDIEGFFVIGERIRCQHATKVIFINHTKRISIFQKKLKIATHVATASNEFRGESGLAISEY